MTETQTQEPQSQQTPGQAATSGLGWMIGLFFLSGISGLMYEVIWVRKLTLIFGNTAFAVSTVLAAFMAGLGFGGLWFGRRVEDKPERGLMWYVWLQVGIGLSALLSMPLLDAFGPLYVWVHRTLGATWYVMSLVRLLCAFVALLPATFLMGGTLPVLCRYFVRDPAAICRAIARLYGANTLGAMAGCFMASFVLVGAFGVAVTLWIGAALNFLAAAGAWALGRLTHPMQDDRVASDGGEALPSLDYPRWSPQWFLVAVALCGFCSLAYEALWTRLLSHIIGLHVQAFGLMLFTFLLGIGLGSIIVGRLKAGRESPLGLFILIEILIGCFALLSLPLFVNVDFFGWLTWRVVGAKSPAARTAIRFGKCMGIMIVPSLLMGAAFPLAASLYSRSVKRIGRGVGVVYAWNTFGAILGSLAAGFVLMPLLGVSWSVVAVALVNIAVGLVLLVSCPGLYRRAAGVITLAVLIAGCAAALSLATVAARRPAIYSVKNPREFEVIWHREDIAGSVSVLQSRADASKREVNVNGMSVAYTAYPDVRIQKLLAHLPLLLHQSPQDVLVVGFGSGSTCGTTMLYPVRTLCVELQRLERLTAPFFTDLNYGVLQHPRFDLRINDGRNFLFLTGKRFDAISRDTLPPKESQDLFSVEFYELCRSRLKPGGVVCGFLPTDLCPTADYFKVLVRSFCSVFPHASLWYAGPEACVFVGQVDPLEIDYNTLAARMADGEVKADLARIHADNPLVFLSYFVAAGERLQQLAGPGPVATDDRPLGFHFDDMGLPYVEADEITRAILEHREPIAGYLTHVGKRAGDRDAILADLDRAYRAVGHIISGRHRAWRGELQQAMRAFEKAMETSPHDDGARYYAARAAMDMSEGLEMRGRFAAAFEATDQALRLDPHFADPHMMRGKLYEAMGSPLRALAAYDKALQVNPQLTVAKDRVRALKALAARE